MMRHPEPSEVFAAAAGTHGLDDVRRHVSTCDTCRALAAVAQPPREEPASECARFDSLLSARVGTLAPADSDALRVHLDGCEDCREIARLSSTGEMRELQIVDPSLYSKEAEVGSGGMGRTYRARDLRLGRVVALKEARDPALRARFEREARLTASLQHPAIVSVHEAGRWPDGTPFYAMELIEGTPLDVKIAAAKTRAERLALLPSLITIAEALAYAHENGVIHRDVKPQNIVLGEFGKSALVDWGLAKRQGASGDALPTGAADGGLTILGAGTPAYMSPEQAQGREPDARVDVYSLGATIYHLLCGSPPYANAPDARKALLAGPPRALRDVAPDVPRELESVVAKAMARDPGDRYASAKDLAAELTRFQSGRLVSSHTYSLTEFLGVWWRRNRARVRVGAVAVAALASIGVAAIVQIVRERDRAQRTSATLLVEQGRQELLAGHPSRALALLSEGYQRGARGPGLQYLIGSATRQVEARLWTTAGEAIEFSPDSSRILGQVDGRLVEWNASDGTVVRRFDLPGPGHYAKDGSLILGASGSDAVLLDASTGNRVRTFRHPEGNIDTLVLSPDARRVMTLGTAGTRALAIWSAADGTLLARGDAANLIPRIDHNAQDITRTGKHLVLHHFAGNRLEVWDLGRAARVFALDSPRKIVMADVNAAGDRVVTAHPDGTATVWDMSTARELHTLRAHTGIATSARFLPDGKRVVVAGTLGGCTVWDVDSGALLLTLPTGIGDIEVTEQSVIATVGNGVQLWSSNDGTLLASFEHRNFADDDSNRVMFSPDGDRFVLTGRLGISMWNARAGRLLYRLEPEDVAPMRPPEDPQPLLDTARKRYRLKTRLHANDACLEGNRVAPETRQGPLRGAAFMDRCQNVTGQSWWLQPDGGFFLLKTDYQGADRCLLGTESGAFLESCEPVASQRWTIAATKAGYYELRLGARCLESNSREAGAPLGGVSYLMACTGAPGQLWRLETPFVSVPAIDRVVDDVARGRIFFPGGEFTEGRLEASAIRHGRPVRLPAPFTTSARGLELGDDERTFLMWTDDHLLAHDLDEGVTRWSLAFDSSLRGAQTSWMEPQALLLQYTDGTMRLLDLDSGAQRASLHRADSTGRGAGHPCADAACVLVHGSSGTVSLSRLDGTTISVLEGLPGFFAPDEDRPPTGGGLRGERKILATRGGERVVSWLPPRYVEAWTPGNTVRVWDGKTGKVLFDVPPGMGEFAITRPGDFLATLRGPNVEIRSMLDGELLASVRADGYVALLMDFDLSGELLATVGASGKIRIWDWRTETLLDEFQIPPVRPGVIPEAYTCCDFSEVPKLDFHDGYLRTTASGWHAVWDTRRDSRSPEEISAVVDALPWRFENGRLVPRP